MKLSLYYEIVVQNDGEKINQYLIIKINLLKFG